MELKKIKAISKKTGKEFTGYVVSIGKFQTPMFFPTPIEQDYLEEFLTDENN